MPIDLSLADAKLRHPKMRMSCAQALDNGSYGASAWPGSPYYSCHLPLQQTIGLPFSLGGETSGDMAICNKYGWPICRYQNRGVV